MDRKSSAVELRRTRILNADRGPINAYAFALAKLAIWGVVGGFRFVPENGAHGENRPPKIQIEASSESSGRTATTRVQPESNHVTWVRIYGHAGCRAPLQSASGATVASATEGSAMQYPGAENWNGYSQETRQPPCFPCTLSAPVGSIPTRRIHQ